MKINLAMSKSHPGTATGLMIRMWTDDGAFDKYCAIQDRHNKASQIQMFHSLTKMIEEVCKAK